MSLSHDACPFEPASRAAHCKACCEANESLTPCVAAWLRGEAVAAPPRLRPVRRQIEGAIEHRQAA